MKNKTMTLVILAAFLAILAYGSLYTVKEGQQALIMRLGEIKTIPGSATQKEKENKQNNNMASTVIEQASNLTHISGIPEVFSPGLHFKLPLVETVLRFDIRIQTLQVEKSRIVTSQKKDVNVDYYVKWRIDNLAEYYKSTGGLKMYAENLLRQQTNNSLRAEFGRRTIPEVVSDARSEIMNSLLNIMNNTAKPLGITVIDVRIKSIDLPGEVSSAVFDRMRAERERVAAEHRAEGRSNAEAIKAKADADVIVILAKAKQEAANTMAEGDAQAAQLYAKAYGQDAGFYNFYKSLEAYRKIFSNQDDILVLSPTSEFFHYFNSTSPNNNK